jgi:hypothetical protein
MTGDKFDFSAENSAVSEVLSILIKAANESQWIGEHCETDSGEGQRG